MARQAARAPPTMSARRTNASRRMVSDFAFFVVASVFLFAASPRILPSSVAQETATEEAPQCHAESNDPECIADGEAPKPFTRMGSYQLLETVPHDVNSFTQGLELLNATHMYESAGLYKESTMRLVEIATGKVVHQTKLSDEFFAEGVSRCKVSNNANDAKELILLTWQEKIAFRMDPETLQVQSNFSYQTTNGEGWGIACDDVNQKRYVSDGTSFLHIWNSKGEELEKKEVHFRWPNQEHSSPLKNVNELELDAHSETSSSPTVLANVWYNDVLIRIQPKTGFVTSMYDLRSLRPHDQRGPKEDCLNGIAQVTSDVYWVTGKLWPHMYKIRLIEADGGQEESK